ncbi:MAG: succinylglutamate desuccinylase/aspartoacylase family protein [Planctomycetota bacterium]
MPDLSIAGHDISVGETVDLRLPVTQTFTGDSLGMPVRVIRGVEEGKTLFVTAAVHGDEINGTGIIHDLMYARRPTIRRGTLILVPVVDVFGFETQSRYMPDRRDLNRCFPGGGTGSLSSRVANLLFEEIVTKCDFGLDLHSAATGRTNFPNVRADLSNPGCRELAEAFGCELMVDGTGPEGSLRRSAVEAGVPTIILEAGEVSKIEPTVLEIGVRGVLNTLAVLGMIDDERVSPPYLAHVRRTTWVRAEQGGLLRFHVTPGELVEKDQPISTNLSVFGESQNTLVSPADGIVLGMTTLPIVKPGEPVCHIAVPDEPLERVREALAEASKKSLDHQVRRDLATNVTVSGHEDLEPAVD